MISRKIDRFFEFFWNNKKSGLIQIDKKEYKDSFKHLKPEELKEAYNRAWEAKNFEIENYWKRANYFWAFQVASFAGYFSVLSSEFYKESPEILYYVICIGFICSLAWYLINKGSKTWQHNWEIHVDLLEDKITGPLYKTVTAEKTYSVSKINEIVSLFFTLIWTIIAVKFWSEHYEFNCADFTLPDSAITVSTIIVILFSLAMFKGEGRGRFSTRDVKLFKRSFDVTKPK